jgi:hypothetical protein
MIVSSSPFFRGLLFLRKRGEGGLDTDHQNEQEATIGASFLHSCNEWDSGSYLMIVLLDKLQSPGFRTFFYFNFFEGAFEGEHPRTLCMGWIPA